MTSREPFTIVGTWLAKPVKFLLYHWVDGKLAHCSLDLRGTDNLCSLSNEAFILASNHVEVPSQGIARSGPSPDTFILERILHEKTRQALHTTPVNQITPVPGLEWLRHRVLREIVAQGRKGLVLGLGHIPFQHDDPASVRAIVHSIENMIIPLHQVLLLYPVGRWCPDLLPDQVFQEGVGFLAIHFQLPILPTYIRGYSSWEFPAGSPPVTVSFGPALRPVAKNRKTMSEDVTALTAAVKSEMLRLREQVLAGASGPESTQRPAPVLSPQAVVPAHSHP